MLDTTRLCYSPTLSTQTSHMLTQTPAASAQSETGLPPNWEVRHSNSKNLPYYFNSAERTSRWEPPAGTDSEKLKHYMAAHHSAGSRPGAVPGVPEGKIRAAHLLVKHRDSRRPSSWREVWIYIYVIWPSFGQLEEELTLTPLSLDIG